MENEPDISKICMGSLGTSATKILPSEIAKL
jgi:hypothetical protein